MTTQKLVYAAIFMGIIMLLLKLVPLLLFKGKIKNKFLQSFLAYIPYAVLTSMTFPEVFHSTSTVIGASIGVIGAIILAYCGQSLIVVTIGSAAIVFAAEQIIKYIM